MNRLVKRIRPKEHRLIDSRQQNRPQGRASSILGRSFIIFLVE